MYESNKKVVFIIGRTHAIGPQPAEVTKYAYACTHTHWCSFHSPHPFNIVNIVCIEVYRVGR